MSHMLWYLVDKASLQGVIGTQAQDPRINAEPSEEETTQWPR